MSHGNSTTTPMNHKAHVGGKQRSKLAKPSRTARRQLRRLHEEEDE